MTGDWSAFSHEDYFVALGLKNEDGYDYGLLGSMGAAGRAKQLLLHGTSQQIQAVGDILKPVISAGSANIASAARRACEGLQNFPGIGMGVASRLLALTRPDALISVNGGSKENLAIFLQMSEHRLQQPAGYEDAVQRISDKPWWNSKAPSEPQELAAWQARAALIDCFVHHWD